MGLFQFLLEAFSLAVRFPILESWRVAVRQRSDKPSVWHIQSLARHPGLPTHPHHSQWLSRAYGQGTELCVWLNAVYESNLPGLETVWLGLATATEKFSDGAALLALPEYYK